MRTGDDEQLVTLTCGCCHLEHRIRDRDGEFPTKCDECEGHQGQLPENRAKRAEAHEAMVRERLAASKRLMAEVGAFFAQLAEAASIHPDQPCSVQRAVRSPRFDELSDQLRGGARGDRVRRMPRQDEGSGR